MSCNQLLRYHLHGVDYPGGLQLAQQDAEADHVLVFNAGSHDFCADICLDLFHRPLLVLHRKLLRFELVILIVFVHKHRALPGLAPSLLTSHDNKPHLFSNTGGELGGGVSSLHKPHFNAAYDPGV